MENRKRAANSPVQAVDENNTVKPTTDYAEIATKVADIFSTCMPQIVHAVRQCVREEDTLDRQRAREDDAADHETKQDAKKAATSRHLAEFAETLKFVLAHKNDLADAAKILSELSESCPALITKIL